MLRKECKTGTRTSAQDKKRSSVKPSRLFYSKVETCAFEFAARKEFSAVVRKQPQFSEICFLTKMLSSLILSISEEEKMNE
jgi:hypothetical protein